MTSGPMVKGCVGGGGGGGGGGERGPGLPSNEPSRRRLPRALTVWKSVSCLNKS